MLEHTPRAAQRPDDYLQMKDEVEHFLYTEADLLDERLFRAWLDLLDEELVYWMPIRRNVKYGQHAEQENTRFGKDISWFDEDKWTLTKRVEQIETGEHWAEEPLSRVTHMVSNVRIQEIRRPNNGSAEVVVRCRFLIYQNRVEYETNLFVGKRTDTLRKIDGHWKLLRREIILDQNVLLAQNLTVFF